MVASSTPSAPPARDGMTRRGATEHGQAACSTTTGGSGSCRTPGRLPGGGRFCSHSALFFTWTSSSLGPPTTSPVGCALWWRPPVPFAPSSTPGGGMLGADGAAASWWPQVRVQPWTWLSARARQVYTKRARYPTHCSCQVLNRRALVVVVVRTLCTTCVSLHTRRRCMHLIG